MTWIQSQSLNKIDLKNPDPESFDIDDIALGLSHVCRYSGQCSSFYSVAEHSLLCALQYAKMFDPFHTFTVDEYDDLIEDAFKIVRDSQRASTSLIQRKLRIGYPRAARLMDELSALGYVGPSKGSGIEREVFIAPDEEFGDKL